MRKGAIHHADSRINSRIARVQSAFESKYTFSRKLVGHKSCVNVVAFSRGEGRWLASGGDDLTVKLWDFHQEALTSASCSLVGHTSNIFCLGFSARNQHLFSGGLDSQVIQYDISTGTTLSTASTSARNRATHLNEDSTIRGLSCSPENEDEILTTSEDGHVSHYDLRTSSRRPTARFIPTQAEQTDIQYHPQSDKLFLTSDIQGNVCLRDTRMAFNCDREASAGGAVMTYVTGISRKSVPFVAKPEASSIRFDRDGKKFSVINLHHFPTIYSTADPYPLAVCSERKDNGVPVSSDSRTYSNSCTTKHASFGGPGLDDDVYFGTGSDDFCAYVWKIPDLAELEQKRRTVSRDRWMDEESPLTIGYTTTMKDELRVPVDLDDPLFRLKGNRSIVNNCLFHPHLPQIITSGVERHIAVHSPSRTAPNMEFSPTDPNVRALPELNSGLRSRYAQALVDGPGLQDGQEAGEEQRTVDFFDGVIREYEGIDVFVSRYNGGDSDSDSDEEMDIY